jgi:hypothetical protein
MRKRKGEKEKCGKEMDFWTLFKIFFFFFVSDMTELLII